MNSGPAPDQPEHFHPILWSLQPSLLKLAELSLAQLFAVKMQQDFLPRTETRFQPVLGRHQWVALTHLLCHLSVESLFYILSLRKRHCVSKLLTM